MLAGWVGWMSRGEVEGLNEGLGRVPFGYARRMRVRVLLFGVLKDELGAEREVELRPGASVADVLAWARGVLADERMVGSLAVAVNREYAVAADVVDEGDEVSLLPPVSGGAP